jgi:hypothetical protein
VQRWLGQRDLQLIRSESDYLVLSNQVNLPRAAVYGELPPSVRVIQSGDVSLDAQAPVDPTVRADQRTAYQYVADRAAGPGVAFLAEGRDPGWKAALDGAALDRVDGGWGNAFALPAGRSGRLDITHPRTSSQLLWMVVTALAWVVVIGGAFSTRRRSRALEHRALP